MPRADERSGEAAERLRHQDQLGAIADRLDDRVGVLRQPGRLVLAGKVDRHHLTSALFQLGRDQVPVEGAVAGSVDKDIGGHRGRECPELDSNQRPIP